jgi:hypothetical protein
MECSDLTASIRQKFERPNSTRINMVYKIGWLSFAKDFSVAWIFEIAPQCALGSGIGGRIGIRSAKH